jgi:hypothetical protein
MVSLQRPLFLRFFRMARPLLVEILARKPDVLITFFRDPFNVCFDMTVMTKLEKN